MPTITEFQPLRAETIDTIRARMDASVNAGLDPTDQRWTDTTPSGFYYDHTQSFGLEAEFLWDYASTELPASFFLPFSWGIYLDYWGDMLNVPRNDAVAATGAVTLANAGTEDVDVSQGVQVAAPAPDVDSDPIAFNLTAGGTIPAGGELDVPVVASDVGAGWDVSAGGVTLVLSALPGVTVTNALPISGGADVEDDETYKGRLLLEFSRSRGGGTKADYIADSLLNPSVGNVVVQRAWAGPGTVRVILTDHNNDPVSQAVIDDRQLWFDAGNGDGHAPINATVTVATVATVGVTVATAVTHDAGFNLDGAGGLEATLPAINAAVQDYIDSLVPGAAVQHDRVLAAIIGVTGVYAATVTLTPDPLSDATVDASGDVQLGTLEVAQLTAVNAS